MTLVSHKNKQVRFRYQKEWYEKNKDRILKKRREQYLSYSDTRKLVNSAKQRANKKGLEFEITPGDIFIPEFCPILKKPLIKHTRYAPSIDRIDSSKGYTKNNIWVISRRANLMKNDATIEDLKRFAKWAIKL